MQEEKLVNEAADGKTFIELSLNHDGLFNLDAYLILKLGEENSGKNAKLYYYNTESGKLELQSSTEIGANGETKLMFTHASDYVIVIDEDAVIDDTVKTADQSPYAGFFALLLTCSVTVIYTVRKRKAY